MDRTLCSLHKCINAEPSPDCVGRASQPQDSGCCKLCQGSWNRVDHSSSTLPHKIQPLDRCFFKSLKSTYNISADNWMTSPHGQSITFYDMVGIFGTAFLRTSTTDKAINGFRACGLWPFHDTIFQDNEFATAAVTEEGSPIHDTTEQADAAAVANVTHADVHAVDVPVVVDHQDFPAAPTPGPSGLQSSAAATPRQSLSVEGMCTMLTRTIYTGHTSVNVQTMDIPKPFHNTLEAKHA